MPPAAKLTNIIMQNESSAATQAPAAQSLPLEPSLPAQPFTLVAEPVPDSASPNSDLHQLLGAGPYRLKEERALIQCRTVEPATNQGLPSGSHAISAPPSANPLLRERMRNGKIARLPKLERGLVNKLLHNHVPYSKIVWALSERGITVTERNVSNWRTRGGYREWCAEQENQLRLAHLQDHLTDYLRKHDAQQLPEVGLQVASTQLTSLLLNPQTAAPLLADPTKYAKVVDSLDKCSARLTDMQEERYETVRRASIKDTVPNIRYEEARDVEVLRQIASAEKPARSAREEDIPHRNDLPPREELPYRRPGPTFGEMLLRQTSEVLNSNRAVASPSSVAQPASAGSPPVTQR